MRKIVWDGRFQVGVQVIDDGNLRLIGKVNGLIETIRKEKDLSQVKAILSDFANHVNRHFRFEETRLRDRLNSFQYSDHKERHLFFEDFLRSPILVEKGENQTNIEELADFVVDWIDFHICHLDKSVFADSAAKG